MIYCFKHARSHLWKIHLHMCSFFLEVMQRILLFGFLLQVR